MKDTGHSRGYQDRVLPGQPRFVSRSFIAIRPAKHPTLTMMGKSGDR